MSETRQIKPQARTYGLAEIEKHAPTGTGGLLHLAPIPVSVLVADNGRVTFPAIGRTHLSSGGSLGSRSKAYHEGMIVMPDDFEIDVVCDSFLTFVRGIEQTFLTGPRYDLGFLQAHCLPSRLAALDRRGLEREYASLSQQPQDMLAAMASVVSQHVAG